MPDLTQRQQQILDFLATTHHARGVFPSLREIAAHFRFRSMNAAADHVRALRRKGVLEHEPRRARALRLTSPLHVLRKPLANIPVYGSIPAGFAADRTQEAKGCVSIDIESLGVKPSPVAFALEVRGDSMTGKHIISGDLAVIEPRAEPKTGDVVAALIDGESTLKTFMLRNGKPYLKAENPRYPDLIPAQELVVQGVLVALVRKRK
jgi:repressor LexA